MSFFRYFKSKSFSVILFLFMYLVILLMLFAFKVNMSLIMGITIVLITFAVVSFFWEFFKKRQFYNQLLNNLENLDQKFLIAETISTPNFIEGKILMDVLYDANKSMIEKIKGYEFSTIDFKEYIEMWIHEIKIPISSMGLIAHNNKESVDKKLIEQLRRVDSYVEQVLFYVRSENSETDYLISKSKLDKIINNVALKNKDDLLANNIELIVSNIDFIIYTDSKWLEFIFNQIINNSVKYKSEERDSFIKIECKDFKDNTVIEILDNGIGISEADLPKVFDKTFTGINGRFKAKSTGMGLYIAKKLCDKLGHKIEIESKENEYAKVRITFLKNNFYSVLD